MKTKLSCWMLLVTLILLQSGYAQTPSPQPKAQTQDQGLQHLDPLGRNTPQGTVTGFVRAIQREDYERAAEYLDTRLQPKQRRELARQLGIVLDRKMVANLQGFSNKPEGDLEDGLRTNRDRVGIVKGESGEEEILLDRVQRGKEDPVWLFSSETLPAIPGLYGEIQSVWYEQYVPERLRSTRWLSIPIYRWIALFLLVPLFFGIASLFVRLVRAVLRPVLRRFAEEHDEQWLANIGNPSRLVVLGLFFLAGSSFTITLVGREFLRAVGVTLLVMALCWLLLRLMDLVTDLRVRRLRRLQRSGDTALVRLVSRLSKLGTVIVAGLVLLSLSGVDLTAVLTGLGLGGLAVAFAAQKTLENLFGGIMLISNKPIQVGDFCRAGEFLGVVEDIGLRSTRLRTLERTIVSIPNGQLATMSLENFTLRDRIRFRHMIGLRYETAADQLRYVLTEIRRLLHQHAKVDSRDARVRFVGFGSSSLDVEILAYVLATDYSVFLAIQEDLLLRIMDIIEASGTSVAFPSQTTYVARDSGLNPDRSREAIEKIQHWREHNELPFPDFPIEKIAEFNNKIEYPCPESILRKGK